MILFVHRRDRRNIGDMSCCPDDYFDFGESQRADIVDVKQKRKELQQSQAVIVGGGGLFYFADDLRFLANLPGPKKILWGIGTNTHDKTMPDYRGIDLTKFDLPGIRDTGAETFVPCPSCMSDLFNRAPAPHRDVVVYRHHEHPTHLEGIDKRLNNVASMKEAVWWMASAETVITNTYHGWYWATMLGRKVVIYRPFSSRFYALPWPAAVAHTPEELPAAKEAARAYPEALATARELNIQFAERVRQLIS